MIRRDNLLAYSIRIVMITVVRIFNQSPRCRPLDGLHPNVLHIRLLSLTFLSWIHSRGIAALYYITTIHISRVTDSFTSVRTTFANGSYGSYKVQQ